MLHRYFVALSGVGVLAADPSAGCFEDHVRSTSARLDAQNAHALDLRVVKARGDRGYTKARISVVSHAPLPEEATIAGTQAYGNLPFAQSVPFRYKWEASFDLGSSGSSCADGVYSVNSTQWDADCMLACSRDKRCSHYTWYPKTRSCALAEASCTLIQDENAEATYAKFGTNHLTTAIVDLAPGINKLEVAGVAVDVKLPAQGAGLRGIVIGDPCFSGRWVDCYYGTSWDALNRTVLMLNALAEFGDIDFFAFLGDNFYDQDGRLTSAVWRSLSPAFKQTFLLATPGNHDIWVAGGPGSTADEYDQYGYGFMQFYAQDSLAATETDMFNFSAVPLEVDPNALNNDPSNFFLYHQLGDLGIIAYNGGGVGVERLRPELERACSFVAEAEGVNSVLLFGHWNDVSSGCPAGSDAPHIRDLAATLPGCAEFGDQLRFVEGHTHCNAAQGPHGFLVGAHGMDGCGQYGFAMLDTTSGGLEVSYFEERSTSLDSFDDILACVQLNGASGCKHMAQQWLGPWVDVV